MSGENNKERFSFDGSEKNGNSCKIDAIQTNKRMIKTIAFVNFAAIFDFGRKLHIMQTISLETVKSYAGRLDALRRYL